MHDRLDLVVDHLRLPVDAQQMRHARPIHIGIHQPDRATGLFQTERQAGGNRALPHAAFAGSDRNDCLGSQPDFTQLLWRPLENNTCDVDGGQLGEVVSQRLFERLLGFRPERRRVGGQSQRERHGAVADADVADLVQVDGTASGFGVLEPCQCSLYVGRC